MGGFVDKFCEAVGDWEQGLREREATLPLFTPDIPHPDQELDPFYLCHERALRAYQQDLIPFAGDDYAS